MANLLIDIDGTICEDIPNEESHRYPDALPYEKAAMSLHALVASGHKITYFTSRESKDRQVTLDWLKKHNFPIANLIMDKPRGGKYIWIDNLHVTGFRFSGNWSDLLLHQIKSVANNINY